MATDMLNGQLGNILNLIGAVGGLGAAAMGLVDASKAFWGGPSNFGFGRIRAAVARFLPATSDAPRAFGNADILETLKANWINGVAVGDQKAKARSLIHLRLTKGDASQLAPLVGVEPEALQAAASKAAEGQPVTPADIAILGQFDAVLGAVLDEAYERADQKYRNAAKLLAVVVATVLAIAAGWLIYYGSLIPCLPTPGAPAAVCPPIAPPIGSPWNYFGSRQFFAALLVGISAAPIAPVAKDLASSLQAAVTAVGAARRVVP
jgi:hypothetical protein